VLYTKAKVAKGGGHVCGTPWYMYISSQHGSFFFFQAHREFRQITRLDGWVTALMDSWQQLDTKLVEYAKVEASTQPVIANCLTALEDYLNEIAYPAGQHNMT